MVSEIISPTEIKYISGEGFSSFSATDKSARLKLNGLKPQLFGRGKDKNRKFQIELNREENPMFKWSQTLGYQLWLQSKNGEVIPQVEDKQFQFELNRFFNITERRDKLLNVDERIEIRRRCFLEGPDFAKFCKKRYENGFILANSYFKDHKIEGFEAAKSVYEYFPNQYLIFWEEHSKDYEFYFHPQKAPTKKLENEFKKCLKNLLPDKIDFSKIEDRFKDTISYSQSLIPESDKTLCHALQSWKKNSQVCR